MVPLLACMKAGRVFPQTAREALRALGAAAQHRAFGLVVLKTQGTVRICMYATMIHVAAIPTP